MKHCTSLSSLIRINKPASSIRSFLLYCLIVSFSAAQAAGNDIKSFHALYDLYRNDKQVGETSLQAELSDHRIRLRMTTEPEGLYAIIINQRPYTEVTMTRNQGDFRLDSVSISPDVRQDPLETAQFDWQQSLMTAKRKNKKLQIPLTEAVYDYLSIHWLAAQLILADAGQYRLKFYRNGTIITSTLIHTGTETLELGGEKIETSAFEQKFQGSGLRIKYHYDLQNPWLPVRIERTKKGKKKMLLLLKTRQDID